MITFKVSVIKRTWLRRIVMLSTLPFCVVFAVLQAVLFGLLVIVMEPFRRFIEVCCVFAGMVPTFKQQWKSTAAKETTP